MSRYPLAATGHVGVFGPAWAATGGASPAVLADSSDATYVSNRPGTVPQLVALTRAAGWPSVIGTREQVLGVQPWIRVKASTAGVTLKVSVGAAAGGDRSPETNLPLTTAWQTFTLPLQTVNPATKTAWTSSDVNLLFRAVSQLTSQPTVSVAAVGADLVTCSIPQVTISPVDAQDTSRPVVVWTFDDRWTATPTLKQLTGNVATITTAAGHGYIAGQTVTVAIGDAVFDGVWTITAVTATTFSYALVNSNVAQAAASGQVWTGDSAPQLAWRLVMFNPSWDSGMQISAAGQGQISKDLTPGTYTAYLLTWRYGAAAALASVTFTVAYTSPPAPYVTAVWDDTSQAVDLVVTGFGNLLSRDQGTAEVAVGAWLAYNCTIARSNTVGGTAGGYATRLLASSPGDMSATTTPGSTVVPGVTYQARADYYPTVGRDVQLVIEWRNAADDTAVAYSVGDPVAGTAGGWRGPAVFTATAPPGADRARLRWRVIGVGAGEAHYVDAVALTASAAGQPTGWGPGGFSGWRLLLERSADGNSWTQVRNPDPQLQDAVGVSTYSQVLAVTDHEAPRSAAVRYRASEIATSPLLLRSTVSTPVQVDTAGDGSWWLKAVNDPGLNRGGVAVTEQPTQTTSEQTAVFWPLGRDRPVVVAGEVGGVDGSATITTRTAAEHAALAALLTHQGPLLIQAPFTDDDGVGLQWWVRLVGDRQSVLAGTPGAPRRQTQVTWVDVGPPPVGG